MWKYFFNIKKGPTIDFILETFWQLAKNNKSGATYTITNVVTSQNGKQTPRSNRFDVLNSENLKIQI
jgi:hypothetical protein